MRDHTPLAAVDARTLVPVRDEAGGVVVYVAGRAAYYVLNGEWFAALPEPVDDGVDDGGEPAAAVASGTPPRDIDITFDCLVSTS